MKPVETSRFGISEENVTRICHNRARHMNSEARLAGQSNRIQATDLEDLYYKQGGLCATCGVMVEDHGAHKHPRAIRADHIKNVNRRSTFEARACGNEGTGAPIADILNVQWVCHLCNTVKQIVVGAGADWCEHIANCYGQSSAGFPLRNNADVCGSQNSRRSRRMAWMQEQFAARGHAFSSGDVTAHFAGTELEAHLATYLKELKQIGWCGIRHMGEVRRAVAQEMAEQAISSCEEMLSFKHWCEKFNQRISDRYGWPGITPNRFRQLCEEANVTFFTTRVQTRTLERDASSAEKYLIRAMLKDKGREGMSVQDVAMESRSDTFTATLFERAVAELATNGQIEKIGDRLFYCMNRKEAAKVIGVSVHRLKKWAVFGTGPVFLKNPSNSKGECYYSVRTLFEFAESRSRTRYDKVGWQGNAPPAVASAF